MIQSLPRRPAMLSRAVTPRKQAALLDADARVDRIAKTVRKLLNAFKRAQLVAPALQKFATTGDLAVPMTTAEVGIVLGRSNNAVHLQVSLGHLSRRWHDTAGFHPDDVRAYLAQRRKEAKN